MSNSKNISNIRKFFKTQISSRPFWTKLVGLGTHFQKKPGAIQQAHIDQMFLQISASLKLICEKIEPSNPIGDTLNALIQDMSAENASDTVKRLKDTYSTVINSMNQDNTFVILNACNAVRMGGKGLYDRGTVEESIVEQSDWMLSAALFDINDLNLQKNFLRYLLCCVSESWAQNKFFSETSFYKTHAKDSRNMLTAMTEKGYSLIEEKARTKPILMHSQTNPTMIQCIDAAAPDLRHHWHLSPKTWGTTILAILDRWSIKSLLKKHYTSVEIKNLLTDDFQKTADKIQETIQTISSNATTKNSSSKIKFIASAIGCGAFGHQPQDIIDSLLKLMEPLHAKHIILKEGDICQILQEKSKAPDHEVVFAVKGRGLLFSIIDKKLQYRASTKFDSVPQKKQMKRKNQKENDSSEIISLIREYTALIDERTEADQTYSQYLIDLKRRYNEQLPKKQKNESIENTPMPISVSTAQKLLDRFDIAHLIISKNPTIEEMRYLLDEVSKLNFEAKSFYENYIKAAENRFQEQTQEAKALRYCP